MQALSTRVQRHAVPLKPVDVSDNYGFKAALYVINALSKRAGESAYTEQEARVKVANLIQDSDVERLSLLLRQWYSEDYDEAALHALVPKLANLILTNDVSRYEQRALVNDIEWSALATAFKCCIAVKLVKSGARKGNGWKIAVPTPQIFGQAATREDEDTQCVFVVCQVMNDVSRYVALIPNSQPIFKPGRALVANKSAYEARVGTQKEETDYAGGSSEAMEASEASEAKSESGETPEYHAKSIRAVSRKVSFDDESGTSSGSKAAPQAAVMNSASGDAGEEVGTEPASSEGGSEAGDAKAATASLGMDEQLMVDMEDFKLLGGHIKVADESTVAKLEPHVGEGVGRSAARGRSAPAAGGATDGATDEAPGGASYDKRTAFHLKIWRARRQRVARAWRAAAAPPLPTRVARYVSRCSPAPAPPSPFNRCRRPLRARPPPSAPPPPRLPAPWLRALSAVYLHAALPHRLGHLERGRSSCAHPRRHPTAASVRQREPCRRRRPAGGPRRPPRLE
ncbi:hypothetical protein FGB62_1g522 [Gracilaria domingensis]|nr:hypothetical protein FGB62_1g522 [Gracilaria domingensis]